MTPERMAYETALFRQRCDLQDTRSLVIGLILGAEAAGVVVTIENESLQPPAMGNTNMIAKLRPSLAKVRELDTLRLAAEQSEKELPC